MKDRVFHVSVALLTAMVSVAMSFDAPRLTGIVMDGAQDDWGDRGFRVERLALHDGAGAKVTPAPDGAGTLRFGWDDGGLLLLLALPTSRVENATGTVCTVNLIVRDGARPLNWWQAMVDLPQLRSDGAATSPVVRLIEHRHDQWIDPREARQALAALAPLAVETHWARTNDWYSMEARLPWGNLGFAAEEGAAVRVQLQVWKGGPSLSWFPYGWSEKCTRYSHSLRLTREPSPPLVSPEAGETPARSSNVWHREGFSVYIPEGRAKVRGVYVTLPGNKHKTPVDETLLGGYTPMVCIAGQRAFVEEAGFALMGAGGPGGDAAPILQALRDLAEIAKHPELATVPIIADGYSMGSVRTLDLLRVCPERILAFTSMSFMNSDYMPPEAALKVPGLLYTGPNDQYGKGYPAAFAANRAKGALWALIVQPQMGHSTGDCPVLLYPFYKDIIRARLVDAPDGSVSMRDIDPDVGWLGDAKSFAVEQAKRSKGDPKTDSWLSSAYVANLWRLLNTRPAGRLGIADILEATRPH